MRRLSLRVPESMLEDLDEEVEAGHWPNRSEAIRAGIREVLDDVDDEDERPSWGDFSASGGPAAQPRSGGGNR